MILNLSLSSSSNPTTPDCLLNAHCTAYTADSLIKSKSNLFGAADLEKYPLF